MKAAALAAALLGFALAAGAAGETPAPPPKPRTFALVSAIGDQFHYVRRRPQVGTNFEPFTRHAATVAKGAIDTAVLRGLDRTIAASDPAAERVFLILNPAEMDNVPAPDRERVAIGKVVAALEPMKQREGWEKIFVVTPHWRFGEIKGMGSKLGGVGVFVQPLARDRTGLVELDSALDGSIEPDAVTPDGKPTQSSVFVAPYFYTKLWVIDPKTLQVIDSEERYDVRKIHDPMWTAVDVAKNFTPEQLARQVESFVENSSSRALREAIGVVTVTDPKAVPDPKAAPPAAPAKP